MRLTTEQLLVIDKYISDDKINKAKLISYLERNCIVKKDIFTYISVKTHNPFFHEPAYCGVLKSDDGFRSISRETFLRRIPFYFYLTRNPITHKFSSPLSSIMPDDRNSSTYPKKLEELYKDLEFMFYDLGLSLDTIFGYIPDQIRTSKQTQQKIFNSFLLSKDVKYTMFDLEAGYSHKPIFPRWRHYLRLCQQLGWTDYTPDRFLTKYNYALEATGLNPIIYAPLLRLDKQYYSKTGQTFSFIGHFLCEDDGTPILRWTCIKAVNPGSVSFSDERSGCGELIINASPETVIYTRGLPYQDDSSASEVFPAESCEWKQIYAGPRHMFFNHHVLKQLRLSKGMTQQDVALAIDASVRTYQKWEAGETTPDCQNLIRIMNWLDIPDIQHLISYAHIGCQHD